MSATAERISVHLSSPSLQDDSQTVVEGLSISNPEKGLNSDLQVDQQVDQQDNGVHEPLIVYNEEYRVLICSQHGYMIDDLGQHLSTDHDLSPTEQQAILDEFRSCVVVKAAELDVPLSVKAPIRGLKPPVDAFKCMGKNCNIVSLSYKEVKDHASSSHPWKTRSKLVRPYPVGNDWVYVQTFFDNGPNTRYIVIEGFNPDGDSDFENEDAWRKLKPVEDFVVPNLVSDLSLMTYEDIQKSRLWASAAARLLQFGDVEKTVQGQMEATAEEEDRDFYKGILEVLQLQRESFRRIYWAEKDRYHLKKRLASKKKGKLLRVNRNGSAIKQVRETKLRNVQLLLDACI